jgi:hypothetical protein
MGFDLKWTSIILYAVYVFGADDVWEENRDIEMHANLTFMYI